MIAQSKTKSAVVDLIRQEIQEFAGFLPRIAEEDPHLFAQHIQSKLDYLNAMSRCCPDDRTELMQYCVQMCAPEHGAGKGEGRQKQGLKFNV